MSSLVYRPNWLFKLSHPNQPTTKQPTNPRGFLCSRQKPREFRIQCPVFLLLLFYFLLSYLLTILVQRPLSLFLNHFLNPGSRFFFFFFLSILSQESSISASWNQPKIKIFKNKQASLFEKTLSKVSIFISLSSESPSHFVSQTNYG